MSAPFFQSHIVGDSFIQEGDPLSLSVELIDDNSSEVFVDWYRNGQIVSAGSRINAFYERGLAVLDVNYTLKEDGGDYICVARNNKGMSQSEPFRVELQLDTAPKVAEFYDENSQRTLSKPERRGDFDPSGGQPPKFNKPLQPQQVTIKENDSVNFQTYVSPSSDPSLEVEWFKDGQPLKMGCRFNLINERGYVLLDILYAYPEDSGQYYCVARNNNGQAQTNVATLRCLGQKNILTDSHLARESVDYLTSIDAPGDATAKYDEYRYREHQEPDSPPQFDIAPEDVETVDNGPAKFLIKVSGFPTPRVKWFINGNLICSTSNYRIYKDGTINYLEFYHCKGVGVKEIRVVAKNKLAEIAASAQLRVVAAEDFRPELRHVAPESESMYKRLHALKKVDKTEELNVLLKKPKAHVTQFRRVERDCEVRARSNKPNVTEAENLYLSVQNHLKRADGSIITGVNDNDDLIQLKLAYQQSLQQQQHQQEPSEILIQSQPSSVVQGPQDITNGVVHNMVDTQSS